MKLKTIFFILVGVWSLDFLSTIIGINFFNGIYEKIFVPSWFFSLGLLGWVLFALFAISLLFFSSCFFTYFQNCLNKEKDGLGFMVTYTPIVIFGIFELFVLFNNLFIIKEVVFNGI